MNPRLALRHLLADLAGLFPRRGARWWFLLAATVPLQAGFWYLATPGPQLLALQPRTPVGALLTVGLSGLFLLAVPLLLATAVGFRAEELGLTLGDWRFGLAATAPLALLLLPLLYLGAADPTLQAAYPWPGEWLGERPQRLLLWAPIYALYYLAFEFFYRGLLLRGAATHWGAHRAQWLQATAATLIHLGKPLSEVVSAFPASLLFGALALRSRSLVYPVLLHLWIGLANDVFVLARTGKLSWWPGW